MNKQEARSAKDWSSVEFKSPLEAAVFWYAFGLIVMPTVPGEKRSIIKWDPWIAQCSLESIKRYWGQNPTHEVAAYIDKRFVVFDGDTAEAVAALYRLEQEHGLPPLFIIKTSRGEHHYFLRPSDVFVKTDSHDSRAHPERIDVKANRSLYQTALWVTHVWGFPVG